jgi:hypothetical protein
MICYKQCTLHGSSDSSQFPHEMCAAVLPMSYSKTMKHKETKFYDMNDSASKWQIET